MINNGFNVLNEPNEINNTINSTNIKLKLEIKE